MSHSFLPDLNKEMKCGVLSNTRGQILIIYDQDITSTIQWIEYDPADVKFTLIHEDGETQEIGVPIDSKMKYNLLNGQEVTLVQMSDKEIKSTQIVVLVIKEYWSHNRRRLPELVCLISSGKYKEILNNPDYAYNPDITNELAASASHVITVQNILELSELLERNIERYTGYKFFLRSIEIVRYERYKLSLDDRKIIFDRLRDFLRRKENYDVSRLSDVYDLYMQYNFEAEAKDLLNRGKVVF